MSYENVGQPTRLLPLENGGLLAGTAYRGLFYFDGNKWTKLQLGGYTSTNYISDLGIDREGDLWIYAAWFRGGGFAHYTGHIPPASGAWQEDKSVTLTKWDSADCQQWQAFATGGYTFHSPAECERINAQLQTVERIVKQRPLVAVDADDEKLWWATPGALGHLLDNDFITLTLPVQNVYALVRDPVQGVWVGTDKGLAYSDGITLRWVSLGLEQCAFRGMPRDIAVDTQGIAWLLTTEGVAKLPPGESDWQMLTFASMGAEKDYPTRAIVADRQGGIWATQSWNVWHWTSTTISPISRIPNQNCTVTTLQVDSNGNLWLPAYRCGIFEFNPTTSQWTQSYPDTFVEAVSPSINGTVYARGYNGLYWYTGTITVNDELAGYPVLRPQWRQILPKDSAVGQYPFTFKLAADHKGGLWIGATEEGRLWYYKDGQLEQMEQQFDKSALHTLHVDGQDWLWLVENDLLMVCQDCTASRAHWRRIPLPISGSVSKLTDGPDGRLWLIGHNLIAIYDPNAGLQP